MTSARPFATTKRESRSIDGGRSNSLTWLGLAVAALGWIVLVAAIALPDNLVARDLPVVAGRWHGDLVAIGQCAIGSGFALAVIGTLRTGFGALDRFFTAALDRSASRASAPAPAAPAATPIPDVAVTEAPRSRRPYNILADGSVEVETILGTRRFASMAEARDFI